jgi:hypothetical protein
MKKSAPTNLSFGPQSALIGFHVRRPATRTLPPNGPVTDPVPDETPQHRPPLPFPVNHGPLALGSSGLTVRTLYTYILALSRGEREIQGSGGSSAASSFPSSTPAQETISPSPAIRPASCSACATCPLTFTARVTLSTMRSGTPADS